MGEEAAPSDQEEKGTDEKERRDAEKAPAYDHGRSGADPAEPSVCCVVYCLLLRADVRNCIRVQELQGESRQGLSLQPVRAFEMGRIQEL